MHKILSSALVLGASIAIAAPSQAADLSWSDPSANVLYAGSSAFQWTGLYAGGSLGYGFGTITTNAPGNPGNDLRGFEGGAQAGFNYDLGGLVIGGEIDGQLANVNYSQTLTGVGTSGFSVDYFGSARARLGFTYNEIMPYITGGVAGGQATGKFEALGGTFSQSNFHTGWTAGAGVEVAATDNVTVKLEYLHTDLGTKTYFQGAGAPTEANFRFGTVRVGANFHF